MAGFTQPERVHSVDYPRAGHDDFPARGYYALDPDTSMKPRTFEAALRAAGAGILGVGRIMRNPARRVFARHVRPGIMRVARAMGFCFLNNIAIAVAHRHGRITSCLEGGYQLAALGRSVAAYIRNLED
jgi:acetoin utilization deacetylase AcuC-like enzyme